MFYVDIQVAPGIHCSGTQDYKETPLVDWYNFCSAFAVILLGWIHNILGVPKI